jgi:hypothetical protein
MPRPLPCTCNKKCKTRSSSAIFFGLFLLSLSLHVITLVCYLDLRSEVKREIVHQKRDSIWSGGDLPDAPAFSHSSQPANPGSVGEGREVSIINNHQVPGAYINNNTVDLHTDPKQECVTFIPNARPVHVHSAPLPSRVPRWVSNLVHAMSRHVSGQPICTVACQGLRSSVSLG